MVSGLIGVCLVTFFFSVAVDAEAAAADVVLRTAADRSMQQFFGRCCETNGHDGSEFYSKKKLCITGQMLALRAVVAKGSRT